MSRLPRRMPQAGQTSGLFGAVDRTVSPTGFTMPSWQDGRSDSCTRCRPLLHFLRAPSCTLLLSLCPLTVAGVSVRHIFVQPCLFSILRFHCVFEELLSLMPCGLVRALLNLYCPLSGPANDWSLFPCERVRVPQTFSVSVCRTRIAPPGLDCKLAHGYASFWRFNVMHCLASDGDEFSAPALDHRMRWMRFESLLLDRRS